MRLKETQSQLEDEQAKFKAMQIISEKDAQKVKDHDAAANAFPVAPVFGVVLLVGRALSDAGPWSHMSQGPRAATE